MNTHLICRTAVTPVWIMKTIFRNAGIAGAMGLYGLMATASAATATFQEGQTTPVLGGAYSGVQDVMLLVNGGSSSATENFGARAELNVGAMGYPGDPYYRRTLIKFDLTALSGQVSSVQSATLRFVANNLAGSGTVDLFRVASANGDWVEGTGVATGSNGYGSSTWESKIQGIASWAGGTSGMSVSGTDYLASPISSVNYNALTHAGDTVDFVFTDTSFITAWIAGDNPGLFIRQQDESQAQNWISFYASETGINYPYASSSITLRPSLIVNYTAVPEPSCAVMTGLGICLAWMARGRLHRLRLWGIFR